MIAAETDKDFGYQSIGDTLTALYLGASDTLKNTLMWLLMILAENESFQIRCLQEINETIESYGSIVREHCHYINSLLLENMRMFPVVDSLFHIAKENVHIAGYDIPKNTAFQGLYKNDENFNLFKTGQKMGFEYTL